MTQQEQDGRFDERRGDRRQADRRQTARVGVDRRRRDRRASTGAGVLFGLAAMVVVPEARADIYTRVSPGGVTEATNQPSAKDFKLTYRSKGIVIHSPGFHLRPSANRDFDDHIQAAAAHHGISQDLIRAVIQVESQFDRLAISTAGARGLMQLMPATARSMGVVDSFDARQNIFGGTRYLRSLLGR
jgi:soluble lytic murein transglycosylase-like protein